MPYSGGAGVLTARTLTSVPGALLVEARFAFHEPMSWFDGAPILRSKIGVVAQDRVRRLRKELETSRKGRPVLKRASSSRNLLAWRLRFDSNPTWDEPGRNDSARRRLSVRKTPVSPTIEHCAQFLDERRPSTQNL